MDDQYGWTTLTWTPSVGIYSKYEYIAPRLYSIVGLNFEGDIKPAGFLDMNRFNKPHLKYLGTLLMKRLINWEPFIFLCRLYILMKSVDLVFYKR